jgi:hypothetical protein
MRSGCSGALRATSRGRRGPGGGGASDYYWNADSSQVTHYADYFLDLDEGFIWSCVLYPSGSGACGD